MASTHKHIRSSTASKRPTTAIADGQIALNTNATSPGLFFKDSTGASIIKVGPVHVGTTAPNATPAAGGSSGNSTGEVWLDTSLTPVGVKIWNGSAWVNATPVGSTTVQGLLELATDVETQTGSDTARAVTPAGLQSKVSDSTSTTSSTTIASSTAVKAAYDLANAALPKAGGTVTGALEIGSAGSLVFEGATADDFETTLGVVDPTADRSILLPDVNGTVITTGDTGTVTSGMIADGTIVNADISGSAEIAVSKLADGAARQVLQTDAAGTGVEWTDSVALPGSATATSFSPTGSSVPTNGFYLPTTNNVAISTSGTQRATIDANGRLLVGTSSSRVIVGTAQPRLQVEGLTFDTASASITRNSDDSGGPSFRLMKARGTANGSTTLVADDDILGSIIFVGTDGTAGIQAATISTEVDGTPGTNDMPGRLVFSTTANGASNPTPRATIDSSGRLLVGTSSARATASNGGTPDIHIESTDNTAAAQLIANFTGTAGPSLFFGKARGNALGSNTIVANGDELGTITFSGADGTDLNTVGAQIKAQVDGTPGANDMPGRLVFSTTADGASSPTERMRITNGGYLKVSDSGSLYDVASPNHTFLFGGTNTYGFITHANNASYTQGAVITANCQRAANSAYGLFDGWSGGFGDREFRLRGDGNGFCDGSWTGGGADYAEYFEWSDSNPDAEDRRGISVVLDGDKIRPAAAGEDPIGVISGNPSVVGDAAWNKWNGKYLRDEFGTYILEDYEVVDDDGNLVTQQRRKLNPAYDPDVEYISREDRPEWDCVGLMGKLRISKGQPTGSRWIKMRDISHSIEEWLVR
jgi:hypothetical protein